jgi:hypothetical protein
MKTKDENDVDRKRTGRKKKNISKQNSSVRKREGTTVAASPYLPQRAVSYGQDGQHSTETSPNHWERLIKYR